MSTKYLKDSEEKLASGRHCHRINNIDRGGGGGSSFKETVNS